MERRGKSSMSTDRTTAKPRGRRQLARILGVLGLVWLGLAAPLLAYTVYLKDGTKILTREKYRVEGNRAILVLQNGAQTFIPLDQIDAQRTEEANQADLGTAVLIDGGKKTPIQAGSTPKGDAPTEKRLSDLINERGLTTQRPPETVKRAPELQPTAVRQTASGAVDLTTFGRKPYGDDLVAADLASTLAGLGFGQAQVFQGTRPRRPFLLLPAGDEETVLKALSAGAEALMKVRQSQPDKVESLELLMLSPNRERGGQFVLTPEQAADLVTRKVEPLTFFLNHVQF